jgi:hypothetical protein
MDGLHNLVPSLPVSPLALPPPALRIERKVSMGDCEALVTEKRLLRLICLFDTEPERLAGSTLSADLCGPKSGVHLR